ncbi:MAG: NUDIX hydrolase [Melioribacteraceae bacterium]|nr:NUDIX hydrolase [Melioribacteraceae bacterium]MCF8263309.1 NUDIX hydrolase [Melioribacteraceae bacterium]MCF8413559.1 NUDIX hydrolase [Melioribacteraceae bacterium]
MTNKILNFKILDSNKIFHGKVFDIQVDQIEYDGGNKAVREIVLHNGGAVVLPVKADGKIILVKQFRWPFSDYLYELPAGKLEKDEDPYTCACRELTEETGYSSQNVSKLGSIYTTPGFCTEELHIYLAKDLQPGNHSREEGEYGMEVFEIPLNEVKNMIKSGQIKDAKTIAGINYYMINLGC